MKIPCEGEGSSVQKDHKETIERKKNHGKNDLECLLWTMELYKAKHSKSLRTNFNKVQQMMFFFRWDVFNDRDKKIVSIVTIDQV